jgi:hypothetical protein
LRLTSSIDAVCYNVKYDPFVLRSTINLDEYSHYPPAEVAY